MSGIRLPPVNAQPKPPKEESASKITTYDQHILNKPFWGFSQEKGSEKRVLNLFPLTKPNVLGELGNPKDSYCLNFNETMSTKLRSDRTGEEENAKIHKRVDGIVSRSKPKTLITAFKILDGLKGRLTEGKDAVPSNAHKFTTEQLVSFKNEYHRRAKFWDILSEADMADPRALSIAALIWASGYGKFYDDEHGRKKALAEARKRAKAKNDKQKTGVLPNEGKENDITQFADKSNIRSSFSPPASKSNPRIKTHGRLRTD